MIAGVWGAAVGLAGLIGAAIDARGRVRGRYWSWRYRTAYGAGDPPRSRVLADAIAYGRWRVRMRRHG